MKEQQKPKTPPIGEIYKLVKENNKMLRAMRRDALIGGILKLVFWVVMLFVLPYLAYTIYLQPYLEGLKDLYQNVEQSSQAVGDAVSGIEEIRDQIPTGNIQDLLEQFGIGQ